MGRWWRVPVEQSPKKEKTVQSELGQPGQRKKRRFRPWYSGLAGDPQVSEIYLIPYYGAPICEVG